MIAALTGAGLSAAAGLNAFIPIVLVGIFARFSTFIVLPENLMWLQEWPTIIIGLLLLAVGTSTLLLWIGQLVELPDRGLDDALATAITGMDS